MILREMDSPVVYNIPGVLDRTKNRMYCGFNSNITEKHICKQNMKGVSYKYNYLNFSRTLVYFLCIFWCFNSFVIENCYGLPLKNTNNAITDDNQHQLLRELDLSGPDNTTRVRRSTPYYPEKLTNYLQKFGYLPQSDREIGNLRSEDELKDAIRNMQAFANLPVTGEWDIRTQRLLTRPRCGVVDVPPTNSRVKRYTIQGQKWHKTNLTWSLQTRNLKKLDFGRVRRELYRALDVWAQNSRLSFIEVSSEDADIVINFHTGYHNDGYPFDGRGLILAHAFFPGTGRGGDVHFDEDEVWQLEGDSSDNGGTSLFAVAAHEFGHSLGLSHSSVPGALMYPWYQGWKQDFELPDDDRVGIQQLYGAKENKLWGRIPQYEPDHRGRERYPSRPPYDTPRQPVRPPRPTPRTTTTTSTTTTTTPHPRGDKPDTCDTNYDAISVIRSDIFIFRGKYMWRIAEKGLVQGYPVHVHLMWSGLPTNLTHIDAVYERLDKKIVFFIGPKYYLFNANVLEGGYPRDITALGLPPTLDHIDGAMVWGHNSKTYFFSGTMYWRYDEEAHHVELDYPRDMSIWKGVGYYIDDVFQWKDGATYFFKGKGYWKFNDLVMRVENERQTLSAPFWMGCPRIDRDNDRETISKDKYYHNKEKYTASRNDKYRHTYNVNTNDYDVSNDNDINEDSYDDGNGSGSQIRSLSLAFYVLEIIIFIYNFS